MKKQEIPFTKQAGNVDIPVRLRSLDKEQRHAVLATDSGGQPYTSLVAYVLTPDAEGLVFATPKKTTKYRNILRNRRVSLMIDTRSNSPRGYLKSDAVTILGDASPLRKGVRRQDMTDLFIKKHPRLRGFVQAGSTALIFVSVNRIIHAGQFQTVTEWERRKSVRTKARM